MDKRTLQHLRTRAQEEADAQGRQWAAMQAHLHEAQRRLHELGAYEQASYAQPLLAEHARQLEERSLFLSKLREAWAQQRQQCEFYAARLQEQRLRWQAAQVRAQSLDLLAARQDDELQRLERRREQAELDEFAQRRRGDVGMN